MCGCREQTDGQQEMMAMKIASAAQTNADAEARTNPVRFLQKRGWRQVGGWWKRVGDSGFYSAGQAMELEFGGRSGEASVEIEGEAAIDPVSDAAETEQDAPEAAAGALPFPPLLRSALERAGVSALSDLEGKTDEQLLDIKGVAKKALRRIREVVPAPGGGDGPATE